MADATCTNCFKPIPGDTLHDPVVPLDRLPCAADLERPFPQKLRPPYSGEPRPGVCVAYFKPFLATFPMFDHKHLIGAR